MKAIIVISIFSLFFIGCRGKQSSPVVLEMRGTSAGEPCVIRVSEEAVADVRYSGYIDTESVKVIPLETNDESLLAEIGEMLIRDSLIYVLDKKQSAVFVFTDEGKYVNKVDKFGRGPGEYPLLTGFCVDSNWIGILNLDRLLFYNFDYPDSVRIVRMDSAGVSGLGMYSDDNHFYFRPSNNRNIKASVIVADKDLQVKTILAEPKYAQLVAVCNLPFFIPMEDKMFYYQMYNDTIYQITDTTLLATYIFDGGGRQVGDEELQKYIWQRTSWPGGGMYNFTNVFYADSVLSFIVNGAAEQYQGYYSLRSQQLRLIASANRQDDIFNLKLKWIPRASSRDGYFYGVITASQLDLLKVTPKPDSPLAVLKEDSNPVLVKYKVKKF